MQKNRLSNKVQTALNAASSIASSLASQATPEVINYVLKLRKRETNKKKRVQGSIKKGLSGSAPVSNGYCVNNAMTHKRIGPAQRNSEYQDGERFAGRSLMIFASSTASDTLVSSVTCAGSMFQPYNAFTTLWKNYLSVISPLNLGLRAQSTAKLFGFYAIRSLVLKYIPDVPTSTVGSIALSVAENVTALAAVSGVPYANNPSMANVLMFDPCFITTVWNPCSLKYTYNGVKCWSTNAAINTTTDPSNLSGPDMLANYQLLLAGFTDVAASTVIGRVWVDYVVDFYSATPILLTTYLSDPREAKAYSDQKTESKEDSVSPLTHCLSEYCVVGKPSIQSGNEKSGKK
jgi:hypothetical protein